MARRFWRCSDCLAVSATEVITSQTPLTCGLCSSTMNFMGAVNTNTGTIQITGIVAICDDRCTSARGPFCNCKCGGTYHGSNMVRSVVWSEAAIPSITPPGDTAKNMRDAIEYRQAIEAVRSAFDSLSALRRERRLDQAEFTRYWALQKTLKKMRAAKTHSSRMKYAERVGCVPAHIADLVNVWAYGKEGL